MLRTYLILALGTWLLTSCAPAQNQDRPLNSTGFKNEAGISYHTGGDRRIEAALDRPDPPPAQTAGQTTPAPTAPGPSKVFRESIAEMQLWRYDAEKTPKRFGKQKFVVSLRFKDGPDLQFQGEFQAGKLEAATGDLYLSGSLTDKPESSEGEFVLTKRSTQEVAQVFFWAYRADLKITPNGERPAIQGSRYEKTLKELKHGAYGWVNNWAVKEGRAFYQVAIVDPKKTLFAFKGESLRTDDVDTPATSLTPEISSHIVLKGNADQSPTRAFEVGLKDPESAEVNDVLIEVELRDPTPKPLPPRGEDKFMHLAQGPRSHKMADDFNRPENFKLEGVQEWIKVYTDVTPNRNKNRALRKDLQQFFVSAAPLRPILERIGWAYDVSPAYAYLTVVESAYFTGGNYEIEPNDRSSALGPAQLLKGTALEAGLKVTGGDDDERRFLIPSMCGTAHYMRKLVDKFDDKDATIAILGYYRGDGGAAAAIHCAFDSEVEDRKACAQKIQSRRYKSKDYERFLGLMRKYNYSYAGISRLSSIPLDMREYVDKKLAVYFIANDMKSYGFAQPRNDKTGWEETLKPKAPIQSAECRRAVAPLAPGA